MAECFWPGATAEKVADAGERIRRASQTREGDDGFAGYLGSIFVPTDEIALFLLEAASLGAAMRLAQEAAIPSERILEIVRLDASVSGGRDNPTDQQRSFDESSS
jgi:hypothetical protein